MVLDGVSVRNSAGVMAFHATRRLTTLDVSEVLAAVEPRLRRQALVALGCLPGTRLRRLGDLRQAGERPPLSAVKTGLAFHTVPTMTYAANSAWQQLVVLTHNLLTNFQIESGACVESPSRKRTVLHVLQAIQSLRFAFFQPRCATGPSPRCRTTAAHGQSGNAADL